jgi:uncharacterized protein YbjT (DUF2867 family)
VVRQPSARRVAVRALVRDPARAGELAGLAGVEVAAGDMAHPDTLAGAPGVDRTMLISSSDPYMAHVQTTFIDTATSPAGSRALPRAIPRQVPVLPAEGYTLTATPARHTCHGT